MGLITIEQARAHCRVDPDYPAEQIQPYMDGAESDASAYLNRDLFPTKDSFDAALDALPAKAAAASAAYAAAVEAATEILDIDGRRRAMEVASLRRDTAQDEVAGTMAGMVANASVISAILLTVGSRFANREGTVVGAQVAELPLGVKEILRPFRRVMMP
jgi:hypothetical protein